MTESAQNMFLTRDEIAELTMRIQSAAQIKALRGMCIEHRRRPDGSVAVLRLHVQQLFGCTLEKEKRQVSEPNWGALHATQKKS